MTQINIDFNHTLGKIKPMHAVGQPPFISGFCNLDFSPIDYLKQANIPYSRLHDVSGAFGSNRYVDIPNIFRDFDADEQNPASYDFAFTDALLAGMAEYGVEPIFRLGVTIENQCNIKAYRIHPPKDYGKWARICEHIIRHYNEGWADGFHYGITYWEIWNEPENRPEPNMNQMWTGTPLQYYELYDVTAKHLKACFGNTIKVGGYAATGFYPLFEDLKKYSMELEEWWTRKRFVGKRVEYRRAFLDGFFDYITEHQSPIDFFSWHSYDSAEDTAIVARFVDIFLRERGYGHLETMLNEWNYTGMYHPETLGTAFASSEAAAMMILMQNTPISMLCYYDTRMTHSRFSGMFDAIKKKPYCLYYSFYAFGQLYALGTQVPCETGHEKLLALAATDGEQKAVLITYTGEGSLDITTPFAEGAELYLVDEEHMLEKMEVSAAAFTIKENQVIMIKA